MNDLVSTLCCVSVVLLVAVTFLGWVAASVRKATEDAQNMSKNP